MNIMRARTKIPKDIFKEGDWVYGYYFEDVDNHYIKVPYGDENGEGPIVKTVDIIIDPDTLGKCTGVKGYRGRLIFEGHMIAGHVDLRKYEEKIVPRILDLKSEKVESAVVEGIVRYDDELKAFMFDSSAKPRFLWEVKQPITIIADDPNSAIPDDDLF
jgi:hypothetical protein